MRGSWWWDPWIGSQPNLSWVCSINKKNGWDPLKGSHESRSTHSLEFAFILWCFYKYIFIKIVYSHLRYYELCLNRKSSSSLITARKMFHITVSWCNVTMHRWCYLGNYTITMGRWQYHWHQTIMWPTVWTFFHKIQENLALLHKIQVVGNHRYFTSEHGSSPYIPLLYVLHKGTLTPSSKMGRNESNNDIDNHISLATNTE